MHEETLQLHLALLQQSEKEKGKETYIIYIFKKYGTVRLKELSNCFFSISFCTSYVQSLRKSSTFVLEIFDNFKPVFRIRIGFGFNADPDPALYFNSDLGSREPNLCGFMRIWIRILVRLCRHK